MARALLITPQVQSYIDAAVARAKLHPITFTAQQLDQLVQAGLAASADAPTTSPVTLDMRPPGWQRGSASEFVEIPNGFTAAISFEVQPHYGLCAHLSVSVDSDKTPHPYAMQMIMEAFGMGKHPSKHWLEEFERGHWAVNILEPVEWPPK